MMFCYNYKHLQIWNLDNIHEEIHAISRHEKSIEKLYISKVNLYNNNYYTHC